MYKTARQARTALVNAARDARLCLRVLGLETGGEGSCFARQLGKCTGACVGEEPLARHLPLRATTQTCGMWVEVADEAELLAVIRAARAEGVTVVQLHR